MARQSRAPVVLLTRPAPQSQRFAQALQARLASVQVIVSPLMQTEWLHPPLPDWPFHALILTSETGAKAAGRLRTAGTALPATAFCVGPRTKETARAAGFQAISADGDVHALAALIRAAHPQGPLLHIRGEDVAGNLSETLTNSGIETHSAILYAQRSCPLSPAALILLRGDGPVLVPLFSPRSAQILAQALPADAKAPLWIAAISPAAATEAQALTPARSTIAPHPDGGNMLHTVLQMLSADANLESGHL
ncbi:MAG: uroporphyrinogen-III synthase [Alphaproteobacteria bacterium]|nr:uroporphyrinogen-III synthase [Alphaproteobacteria bacterium]